MSNKRWMSIRSLVVGACFVAALPMVGSCLFGGGGGTPSCSEAINSFYDEGCTFVAEGSPISSSEMIAQCREGVDEAPACGCDDEMDDLLECLDRVRDEDCNRCDNELSDMFACFDPC